MVIPLLSVTHGQCNARPTVTFPVTRHHKPIGWYQIILLGNRGTCVLTTCPGLYSIAERPGFELVTYWSQVQRPNHSATEPHCCSKAEPKIFAPPQTPSPEAREYQNLISWRWSLPLPTNAIWWGSMHAISSYRGNRPTHTHTPTHKQTGPITIHCIAASVQCNDRKQPQWLPLQLLLLTTIWVFHQWAYFDMVTPGDPKFSKRKILRDWLKRRIKHCEYCLLILLFVFG